MLFFVKICRKSVDFASAKKYYFCREKDGSVWKIKKKEKKRI